MHKLFKEGITPKVKVQKGCKMCSLKNLCMPEISSLNVSDYIKNAIK